MDPVLKTPQTEIAGATADAKHKRSGMKRPKKLVKGSAAAKRWMAHVRAHKKSKRVSSPKRKVSRKSPARKAGRPRRVGRPRKSVKAAKTPKRRVRKTSRKSTKKRVSRKARK